MRSLNTLLSCLILTSASACASMDEISAEYQKTALSKYSELSVEHFIEKMTIKDDELETEAVFTTRMGSRPNASGDLYVSMISNQNDEFMRAIVPKTGGSTTYQMYFVLEASDWRRPYQINFGTRLGSKPVKRIGIDASCAGGNCTNYEDAVVTLSSAELDEMIEHMESNALALLRFRVKSQSERDYDSAFSLSELKAIRKAAAS